VSRLLASVVVLAALALPAAASAATPAKGQFDGPDGVSFYIRPSPHLTPYVDIARFDGRSGFKPVYVKGGEFTTCASTRTRVFCMAGSFSSPSRASGTVKTYKRSGGKRSARPSATHRWTATREA
jgi:hypothetical protein